MLKQELENKFDKDKVIMKTKLEDAVREKQMLEESHQSIQEHVQKLQDKISQLSTQQLTDASNESKSQKLQELQAEVETIVRERDTYFHQLTLLQIKVEQLESETEKTKGENASH